MKINEAFPSKYLSSKDLNGQTYQLPIASITQEEINDNGGKKLKPVVYFRGAQKGMILNRTNAEAISMVLGDETNDWIGHKLELFSMRVQGPNGMTDGLRCRVILPQAAPVQRQSAPEIARAVAGPLTQVGSGGLGGGDDLSDSIPFGPCR